ncbi:caspase family protein [Rhodopseudomonas sp. HC1]|uniref:caspase family protein n=1 Tax=Rhodopseudomonas infernalis TaxID=2897386 RepID=UPI001EE83578|nr:caspase family protein [Rhodopseudomonas infernalis]MCG6205320.1 caspase family protein [Rhodopseudomonas infernalis]
MMFRVPRLSRRSITAMAALAAMVGAVSVAIGAHAALNKRGVEALRGKDTSQVSASQASVATPSTSRFALVIGNGRYPDASQPLLQPINDARALSAALRREGFDVDMVEDARRADIVQAVERLKGRVTKDSTVMLFFGGYGIQSGRESYMIPVDAQIWNEADVRRAGVSIEQVLGEIRDRGVHAKLAIIDASRRNPYERRFRAYSHGLAPINAPANALVLSSATPGKVAEDSDGDNSVLVSALLGSISSRIVSADAAFAKARLAVTRATGGAQVPSVSSSLVDDVKLSPVTADASATTGG